MSGEGFGYPIDSLSEREKSVHPVIAFIGDTHIGSRDHEGISADTFRRQCEKVAESDSHIVVLAGDILDRNAAQGDIESVLESLQVLSNAGKPVLLVLGNNEDRLLRKEVLSLQQLEAVGVRVLHEEEEATVIELHDKDSGKTSKVAFVTASRILTPEEQHDVMSQVDEQGNSDYRKQVLRNRQLLAEGGRLDRFKKCLASTVQKGGLPIPAVVLHHAPEELRVYAERYSMHANDSQIRDSEYFKQAMIEHQQNYGNIIFGLFGHVEGGPQSYTVEVPNGRSILLFNACSVVRDGEFVITGEE